MIRKYVHAQFADGEEAPDDTEVILLEEGDLKAILKTVMNLAYNKQTDIFECEPEVLALAEELGVD